MLEFDERQNYLQLRSTILLNCLLLAGCSVTDWHEVQPRYDEGHSPVEYEFHPFTPEIPSGMTSFLFSIFGSSDGTQLWAIGANGTILHFTAKTGQWEQETIVTKNSLRGIFGSGDGAQLWTVGTRGLILHSTTQTGLWETQPNGMTNNVDFLQSIFGSSDGTQLWAVGSRGTILHYTAQSGRWQMQNSGTAKDLRSIFGSNDGAQVWAVGTGGTILHSRAETGRWETQNSGTTDNLRSIFGSSDGTQLWAVGMNGTILHSTAKTGRWMTQNSSTTVNLQSIFGSSDGAQVWAVGAGGTLLHAKRSAAPYVSRVKLVPKLSGAELGVRIVDSNQPSGSPFTLSLSGATTRAFERTHSAIPIESKPYLSDKGTDSWLFDFNPADIDVSPGTSAHLQIQLKQGLYQNTFDVDLVYDPFQWFRGHWIVSLLVLIVATLIAALTLLLVARPLWILYIYRCLKIYTLVEQIEVPGLGKLLQFVLKFTILPWFVTHSRTLRAWVKANQARAAASWVASLRTPETMHHRNTEFEIPYIALPLEVKGLSSRVLNQPSAGDLESLFEGRRNVVQIVGPGGGGKSTLAKHIGELALAAGEPGAFKACRLPLWIDEDISDLSAVVKRKINSWSDTGEEFEEPILKALLKNGLLLVIIDRVSERLLTTQDYLTKVHGSVPCNAMLITTRQPIGVGVPELRFIYPQALVPSTLLSFMTEIIKFHFRSLGDPSDRPFSTYESQLDLGKRLAKLITVESGHDSQAKEVPMLPLPVLLFISDAIGLVKSGRSLDELPSSLPGVYANYLKRVNPKVPGIDNRMEDEVMLRAAKVLAKLALGSDYVPKEFARQSGLERLRTDAPDVPTGIDPLGRLSANGVLLLRAVGATTIYRFALDPIAEFLAAEAHFDACVADQASLEKLKAECEKAAGFHNALLLTIRARGTAL